MDKKKIAFKTLGCRLNIFETDALVSQFRNAGYKIVDFNKAADAYIVNTCTVTNQSDKKSRQETTKASRTKPDAVLVVTGCMATNQKENLEQQDRITYVVDNEQKSDVFHLVDSHFKGEIISPDQLKADRFGFETVEEGLHTRSLIKVQDGCNNYCTFCIVPFVRGKALSRPWKDIEKNIREVLDFGFKEIVITGVNIGRYDSDGLNFEDLVEKVLAIPGDFRVRISSIEPEGFGEKLFGLFSNPKLTPHLHLCIQSGSDKMLMKMRRNYTVDEFRQMVSKIRNQIPDFNFTTDLMVGFPGETEDDFDNSLKVIEEFGFSHIHTFKYSIRKGTHAERMTEQVPEKVKTLRSASIREIADNNKKRYRKSFFGKKQTVLVEKIDEKDYASGYGEHYIPVKFKRSENTRLNAYSSVEIIGIDDSENLELIGKLLEE